MEEWFWVSTPRATFGIKTIHRIVVDGAPYGMKLFKGKTTKEVRAWLNRQPGALVEKLDT